MSVLFKRKRSLLVGRYGVGFAYCIVLKEHANWQDIRGIWINTKWWQLWLTIGDD